MEWDREVAAVCGHCLGQGGVARAFWWCKGPAAELRLEPDPRGMRAVSCPPPATSLPTTSARTGQSHFPGLFACGGRGVHICPGKQDGYFGPEYILQLIPPQSCMLQTDSVCRPTTSRVRNVGEKLNSGLEERLGLGRREFSPRAHRLSRLQIYKLKIINNSNQAVINLRSLSMNPDSIS